MKRKQDPNILASTSNKSVALNVRFTFWQHMLSMHQLPLLDALGSIPGCSVRLICPQILTQDRATTGWEVPPTQNIEVLALDEQSNRWLDDDFGRGSWHVFSGFAVYPELSKPFYSAMQKGLHVVGMMEHPNQTNLASNFLRRLRYQWFAYLWRAKVEKLIALGEQAAKYFAEVGFASHSIIEFGYFPEIKLPSEMKQVIADQTAPFEILIVASHENRKRIDLALRAVAAQSVDCHLTILGTGPLSHKLKMLEKQLHFHHPVTWIDRLPNTEVRGRMTTADLFVLPSAYDGWGAVVNEALGAGTPTICSSACGAKALVKTGLPLRIFQSGDLRALCNEIKAQLLLGKLDISDRRKNQKLAEIKISPAAAAQRLWAEFTKSAPLNSTIENSTSTLQS